MDEFSDNFKSAFKGTVRGVKTGFQFTKTAFKGIHVDSLKIGGKHRNKSSGSIRHPTHHECGSEGHQKSGDNVATAEDSSIGTIDEEPLTDEQVQSQVDSKFFDRSYNAVTYELTHMTPSYTDIEEEILSERDATNSRILDLRQKCKIVSTTLEKRVLAHYAEFVQGIEEIRLVNDSLLQTSSDCKKARVVIRKSKAAAASQVALLGRTLTRANITNTLVLLDAMKWVAQRREQFATLVSSGKLVDAMKLLREESRTDIEKRLVQVRSMKMMIEEWRSLQKDPKLAQQCVEAVLTECLTHRFNESTYCNVVESFTVLGSPQEFGNQLVQLLWCIAAQILTKSLLEVSHLKDETASIASLTEAIQPPYLPLCICQMGAKLLDFCHLFACLVRLHGGEGVQGTAEDAAAYAHVHAHIRRCLAAIAPRIANDLLVKLALVVGHAAVDRLDLAWGLHFFVLLDMLIEAVQRTGGRRGEDNEEDNEEGEAGGVERTPLAAARAQLKTSRERFVERQLQLPKGAEVVRGMMEEEWVMSDLSALSLPVARPVSAGAYQSCLEKVRAYLESVEGRSDGLAAPENPFFADGVIEPPDLDQFLQTETFGQYWTRIKNGLEAENLCSTTDIDTPQDNAASGEDSFADGHTFMNLRTDAFGDALGSTLVARASMPPTVLTPSAIFLCNIMTERAARVAVRYPPLAAKMVDWTSDLVSLYIYIVADNFVSISKNVPVERQGDFSEGTQTILAEMHASGARAVGAVGGYFSFPEGLYSGDQYDSRGGNAAVRFPPKVWSRIRHEYASEAHHYALVSRVVACASCIALVFQQEALVYSLCQLLPKSVAEEHFRRVRTFYNVAMELLHTCIYRVCQAIYHMESVCVEIAKLKPKKSEMQVSSYVKDIIVSMKTLNERRPAMPTPVLDTFFLQRFIFVVQATLVREYSKLSKKKLSDMVVMQIQVDAQNFQQQVAAVFGRHNVAMPDYIVNLIKTGFYMDNRKERLEWLSLNHTLYFAADLVNWLAGGDRVFKQTLEDILTKELNHHDTLPMDQFLH